MPKRSSESAAYDNLAGDLSSARESVDNAIFAEDFETRVLYLKALLNFIGSAHLLALQLTKDVIAEKRAGDYRPTDRIPTGGPR